MRKQVHCLLCVRSRIKVNRKMWYLKNKFYACSNNIDDTKSVEKKQQGNQAEVLQEKVRSPGSLKVACLLFQLVDHSSTASPRSARRFFEDLQKL